MSTHVDFEYVRPWPIFALGFKSSDVSIKGKPHAAIAVGSFLKELENRVKSHACPPAPKVVPDHKKRGDPSRGRLRRC